MTVTEALRAGQSRMIAGEPFYHSYDPTNKQRTYTAYFNQLGFVVGALVWQTQSNEKRTDGKSVSWNASGQVLVPSASECWVSVHTAKNEELGVDAVSFGDEAAIYAALILDARHLAAITGQLWQIAVEAVTV